MNRIDHFSRIWGNSWIIGRILIPILSKWGREEKGIVVDYGCGESPFSFCFPHAKAYLRFDINPKDDSVIAVDGKNIPCSDQSVDCFLLFQVLGDISDLVHFFQEVHRVLKPGGKFFIFETVSYPEHDLPHDYFRIMPEGLFWLAGQTGFLCSELNRLGGLFARFAHLWNVFVLGRLRSLPILGIGVLFAIALCNIGAHLLDQLMPHPRLGTDYVAKLIKPMLLVDK